jgi:hypothetical protein
MGNGQVANEKPLLEKTAKAHPYIWEEFGGKKLRAQRPLGGCALLN